MSTLLEPISTAPPNQPPSADELVRFLNCAESYGDATDGVEFKETHISWVALTDDRVYKVKKPVRFAFLDYSTLERRRDACRDEVRLGSRLAPGIYLGSVPITRGPFGALRFGGAGTVLDYFVVMKRLPAERMLDRLIAQRTATSADIERLLDVLVPFYVRAVRGPAIDRHAQAVAIERQARENLETIGSAAHGLPGAMFDRVRASQLQFLKLSAGLFAERIRAGRVCDGHGDLRAEHVCMTHPPVVFDCVEFSLPLRAADVASELAFLAMECDFLGAPELGSALVRGYRARSGDDVPDKLVSFYKSYRACVRCKVELLRAAQQTGSAAMRSRTRSRHYLQLANSYTTEFFRPQLFVMVGAAGTGKSTVADALADALGLAVLRTDAVRHEIAGCRDATAEYGHGMYSDSMTFWTYETLFDRAAAHLREAVSVVLDGTFRDVRQRDRAVELARRYGADVHFVYCRCPGVVARERIAERVARREGISDARPEHFDTQDQELRAATDWASRPVIELDTSQPVSVSIDHVLSSLRSRATAWDAKP